MVTNLEKHRCKVPTDNGLGRLSDALIHVFRSVLCARTEMQSLAVLPAPPFVYLAAAGCLLLLVWQVFQVRREIDGLVIIYSWYWAVVALVGQCACLMAMSLEGSYLTTGWVSAVQYVSGILLLTPQVCTLGARKPGAGPWQWFVVLPLIFVLFWPGLSQVVNSHGRDSIQLSGPAIAGFCLVTVMSAAPGMGTAATAPALVHLVAVLSCVWPCLSPSYHWLPLLTPFLLVWGAGMLLQELRRWDAGFLNGGSRHHRMNQVWLRFQTCYGLIWARRVQDRMMQFQRAEHWTVTLDIDGFHSLNGLKDIGEDELQKPLESFRWALGRFASVEWLERYLGQGRSENAESR